MTITEETKSSRIFKIEFNETELENFKGILNNFRATVDVTRVIDYQNKLILVEELLDHLRSRR